MLLGQTALSAGDRLRLSLQRQSGKAALRRQPHVFVIRFAMGMAQMLLTMPNPGRRNAEPPLEMKAVAAEGLRGHSAEAVCS